MSDDDWEKMNGAELAHILALDGQASVLQAALETPRDMASDWTALARELLTSIGADPAYALVDESTGKPVKSTRLEVLADELRRAGLEEG